MSRIAEAFATSRREGRAAFIPFVTTEAQASAIARLYGCFTSRANDTASWLASSERSG